MTTKSGEWNLQERANGTRVRWWSCVRCRANIRLDAWAADCDAMSALLEPIITAHGAGACAVWPK